ncbi:hypothetical protein E1B28_005799 [Marasmius oreades]|uniref:DUF2421 domain-containing protein n=1 Tax=Marasmius oreades TaxID=181124 RepID=A0A9P7S4K8_9AGAR|nr:uncharacterized protein E1B28_005799 [Marasmius oreades]KAG7095005.1 hypothetical protein E1B28_005799 [Marasmius oreades]
MSEKENSEYKQSSAKNGEPEDASDAGRSREPQTNEKSLLKTIKNHVPSWITTNCTSPRSLKVFLRCWLASWVGFVVILPNASLNTLGTSAFFTSLAGVFLPPNMPVQLFIFMIATLIGGMLLGWGIGAAATRAANAARSMAQLQAATIQVQQMISSNPALQANPAAQTMAIFDGAFLDIRVSVVYGCFLGFGAFIFGLLRAYAPKLVFLSIFGTIGIDIFCTLGPLFPAPRFTLLNSTLTAVGCYGAIAVIATICIFPETMCYSYLTSICQQLDRVESIISLQDDVLKSSPVQLGISSSAITTKAKGLRAVLVGTQKQLLNSAGFVSLEFSWGRWSSDDVKELLEPLLGLASRTAGFYTFHTMVGKRATVVEDFSDPSPVSTRTNNSDTPTHNDTYLLRQIIQSNANMEDQYNVRITDMLPLLDRSTSALRRACIEGVDCMRRNLENINNYRWTRVPSIDKALREELDGAIKHLREELTNFKTTDRMILLEPYMSFLNSETLEKDRDSFPVRNLFLSYVFGSNLIAVSESTMVLMQLVSRTLAKRDRNRLWAPKGLRKLGTLLRQKDDDDIAVTGEDATSSVSQMGDIKDYRRDPDSAPPTNVVQRFMNSIHSLYHWSSTAEAMFVFKYTFISVILWLPAVLKRSARFYYVQKGLWALIMAQTTMNIYASDQIFNLITRLMGTAIGLVLGLAAWYMGNGHGIGNPYGIAATVGLWNIPLVFLRVYAPPQYLAGVLLACATYTLIVGYSWVDGHIPSYGSPGIGWDVAWRRFVLVSIGSGASFVMMMLPPKSGRKAVRRRNASLVGAISNLYAFLIATWISDNTLAEQDTGDGDGNNYEHDRPSVFWIKEFRERLFSLAEEVNAIRGFTALAKWEGNIRGRWPAEDYHALIEIQADMISPLAQLANALFQMNDEWRLQFLHCTRVLNPNFITEVIGVFSAVSQSLNAGEPLAEVLPQRLVGRFFYHQHSHQHAHRNSTSKEYDIIAIDQVTSLNYMYYATGIVAVFQLLECLDELHRITKRICGVVPLKGFVNWRDQFDRSHTFV